jgi:hypothetical protein
MKPYLRTVGTTKSPALSTDGEIYTAYVDFHIVVETNEGFTMWLDNLDIVVKHIKQAADFKLLYWIGRTLPYNESTIALTRMSKIKIIQETGLSMASIARGIKSLKECKVLIPYPEAPKSGFFYVNPSFIWRGTSNKRKISQKAILEMLKQAELPHKEQQQIRDVKSYKVATYKKAN